jgi:GNAT superfamily N-acetyltransferase
VFQRLQPSQYRLLATHLRSLSADDRYLRFHNAYSDSEIGAWVDKINSAHDTCIALIKRSPEGICIVAAAVLQPFIDTKQKLAVAEVSLSVSAEYRQRGLGRLLIDEAKRTASAIGLSQLRFEVHKRNFIARHLLRRAGATGDDDALSLSLQQRSPINLLRSPQGDALSVGSSELPLAVCLHGAGGSPWQFQNEAFDTLQAFGYRCIAFHIPEIAALAASPSRAERCADIVIGTAKRLARQLGEQPILVLGHSLGARVAVEIADLVDAPLVALLNPMPLDGMSDNDRDASVRALSCPRAGALLSLHSGFPASPPMRRNAVILRGERDRVSTLDYARRSALRCIKRPDERILSSAGGHLGMRDIQSMTRMLHALR